VPVYGGSFTLTVNGQGFGQTSQISAGSSPLITNYVDSTQLTGIVPTAALSSPGSLLVTVADSNGTSNGVTLRVVERGDINGNRSVNIGDALITALTVGGIVKPPLMDAVGDLNLNGTTNIGDALVLALFTGRINRNLATPRVNAVSPNPATISTSLTLTGTGFSPIPANNEFLFTTLSGGYVRVAPSTATSTTLTVTVPSNAVTGPLQVYRIDTPLGSPEFPLEVTGTPTPLMLAAVSPSDSVLVSTTVTLTGLGFDATPASNIVQFRSATGTVNGTVTQASASSLAVTVPPTALCGTVTVTVAGQVSNGRSIQISGTPCPVLLSDIWGNASPGETLVLEGTGFDVVTPANNIVLFTTSTGTAPATVLQAGGSQLHVRVPASAVRGNVTVTVSGQTSNPLLY